MIVRLWLSLLPKVPVHCESLSSATIQPAKQVRLHVWCRSEVVWWLWRMQVMLLSTTLVTLRLTACPIHEAGIKAQTYMSVTKSELRQSSHKTHVRMICKNSFCIMGTTRTTAHHQC